MKSLCQIALACLVASTVNLPVLSQEMSFDQTELQAASQGDENHSDNLLTGHEAINGAVVGGRSPSLAPTYCNLDAVNSVNPAPYPSGAFSYGFNGGGGSGNGGFSGSLPSTSTSSVDINIVDNGGPFGAFVDIGLGGLAAGISGPGCSAGASVSSSGFDVGASTSGGSIGGP